MTDYRYFSETGDPKLFFCSETGERGISHAFVLKLDSLRYECGFPFVINSGYRSPEHSLERVKEKPGTHTQGIAADIRFYNGEQMRRIVHNALKLGFGGIGVAKTFVHVDDRKTTPVMWAYD